MPATPSAKQRVRAASRIAALRPASPRVTPGRWRFGTARNTVHQELNSVNQSRGSEVILEAADLASDVAARPAVAPDERHGGRHEQRRNDGAVREAPRRAR